MSTRQHRLDELVLQLTGLVHVRALLELRGASREELDAHAREARRVRAELARLGDRGRVCLATSS